MISLKKIGIMTEHHCPFFIRWQIMWFTFMETKVLLKWIFSVSYKNLIHQEWVNQQLNVTHHKLWLIHTTWDFRSTLISNKTCFSLLNCKITCFYCAHYYSIMPSGRYINHSALSSTCYAGTRYPWSCIETSG